MAVWAFRTGLAAAVAGLAVVAWLLLPRQVHVARSAVISAPQATVFELLDDPSAVRRWSPWRGPGIHFLFSGPRVGVGARMDWTGRETGQETIAISKPYEEVEYRMDFAGRTGWERFSLTPARGGVRVIWRLQRNAGWNPIRRAELFIFRSQAGVELERGLDRLGDVAETMPRVDLAGAGVRLTRGPGGAWAVRATSGDLDGARAATRLFMGVHRLTASGQARVEAAGSLASVVTPVRQASP